MTKLLASPEESGFYGAASAALPRMLGLLLSLNLAIGCVEEEGKKWGAIVNGIEMQLRPTPSSIREAIIHSDARRRGLLNRPALRRRVRSVVSAALIERVREAAQATVSSEAIDAEVARLRKAHRTEGATRAFVVWTERRADAEIAHRDLVASWSRAPQVTRRFTGVPGRSTGDVGFLRNSATGWKAKVHALARALALVGQVAKPVRIDGAWAVVMKTGYVPATRRLPDTRLREIARRRLTKRLGTEAVRRYIARLERTADIEFLDPKLEAAWKARKPYGARQSRRRGKRAPQKATP
jgi:hypothetical protein